MDLVEKLAMLGGNGHIANGHTGSPMWGPGKNRKLHGVGVWSLVM